MASSRVPDNLPAYNPNKSTLAFGDRALPKIRRELSSGDVEVIQQALLLLNDLLHKPENITSAVREGLVNSLSLLLISDDSVIKYRSGSCLQLIAEHALGRQAFLKLNIINSLSRLFVDPEPLVRLHSHLAVEMCGRTKEGVQGLLDNGLIPILVERFISEQQIELKVASLESLHWCLMADPVPGLECRAIERLQPSLTAEVADVKWRIARCLYDLTVPHSGKRTACDCGLVKDLVPLLADDHHLVKTHAASVLMSIAVITEGKYALLNEEGLDKLVSLLADTTPAVRLNAVKALTLLAEAPSGKEKLMKSLNEVTELEGDSDDVIAKAAATAKKTITWLP
ncbi:PREDICTED: radial spoke head 14 homolog [Amphimedon queenslandica]|uniref:Condensin complex subunit 1 C-terminal domain-containing protein n=1 Tax=Amphimedon queenslandica TaxID=400682 RepID=A0A1X7V0A3_AMPQE|nr:PREDICTED: radial spoke head 14 homolog [Amphimedon queenslandica]|eukprot:XP_003386190.1 PREDICTED: radial spoke head 14 homolog [Amphimedon queenslandica]